MSKNLIEYFEFKKKEIKRGDMSKSLIKDFVLTEKLKEIKKFDKRTFEKGINEIGKIYVVKENKTISIGVGIERAYQIKFMEKQVELNNLLMGLELSKKLFNILDEEILDLDVNGISAIRFGIREENLNLVIDANEYLFDKNEIEAIEEIANIIREFIEILLGFEYYTKSC